MEITNEEFKHFRTFLISNGVYKEFMECFRKQEYRILGSGLEISQSLPNYMITMREYAQSLGNSYKDFGAMVFTFASFNWVNGGQVPISFTRKWCTFNLKWGVYCRLNNLKICDNDELRRLAIYYNNQNWLDPYFLSREERVFIRDTFGMDIINGINIITEID